jgi:hypothetical protein
VADGSTKTCPDCSGSGEEQCWECDGEGMVVCSECDGTGGEGTYSTCEGKKRVLRSEADLEAEGQLNLLQMENA